MTCRPEEPDGPDETLALAKVVARLREELARAKHDSAEAALVERATGVLMGSAGLPAGQAYGALAAAAERHGRSLVDECSAVLAHPPGAEPARARVGRDGIGTDTPHAADGERSAPDRSRRERARRERLDGVPTPGPPERVVIPRGLARTLAQVRSAQGAAAGLRRHLGAAAGVDCVLIYGAAAGGGMDLWGDAGLEPGLAEQWRHVPPGVPVAPLRALETGRPVWLADAAEDADRYALIGGPGRWRSRAWLPCPAPRAPGASVGFLRGSAEPFDRATRDLLHHAARLCGAALVALPAPASAGDAEAATAQRLLDALPGSVILLTPVTGAAGRVEDFRVDAASPGALDVSGRRGKELVGQYVLESYPTVLGTPLWHGYLDALESGTPYEGEPFRYEEVAVGPPRHSTFSVRAVPLGRRLVVSWLRHDPGEREALRLADLQRLGGLGWGRWDPATGGAEWSDQAYAIFRREPSQGPISLEDLPGHLVPADGPEVAGAVDRLLREAVPFDLRARVATPAGVRHVRVVAEAVADATGRPVELHGLFQDLTRQQHAEDELLRSERAVAHQHGLLQAERALASRLQHALLPIPEQSLRLAGLDVGVAYSPSEDGVNVGGDWYSAIELPDGRALFVVGDVAGHGLDAVATMAQLRFSAKGMIITGSPLVEALQRLNTLLLHTGDVRFGTATMIMAVYDPVERCLTWAQAGHPPPLLIRDGRAHYLDRPAGVLLGATARPRFAEARYRLRRGDQILLYTDGLVEKPAEHLDEGLARLAETAAEICTPGAPDPLGALLAPLLGHVARRDDTCVVHIRLP
ncbi:SpoIIE family protein phosphatase [Streptomyces sp. NRRL S-87]|uniref:SpoIIE family protein phosphatase n=1 Tax=Streptomyces sp. NRRL S-87 TaxID=1463920 RepID=UPI00068F59BD|nr:SpoIIE family protein phosphatase [Streptomyces sp. NRRL S-87]